MKTFDVAVLGAGPGGYAAAIRAAQSGRSVLVADRRRPGGVCLNEGCIPSKALLHAASLVHRIRHEGPTLGITAEGLAVDFAKLQAWKNGVVTQLTGGVADLLKRHGVHFAEGEASLPSSGVLTAGGEAFGWKNLILAAGGREIVLPFLDPAADESVWVARQALDAREIPETLAVIGGGVIGLELGQYFARMGSRVTVFEKTPGLLPHLDARTVRLLSSALAADGLEFRFGASVTGWKKGTLSWEEADGTARSGTFARVLNAVGRRPNGDRLGLDTLGLAADAQGFLPVNPWLQTARPDVYAVGDLVRGPQLAHRATSMGLRAAANAAGQVLPWDVRAVPGVVYTDPEVAWVGETETSAKARGLSVRVGRFPYAGNGRALANLASEGQVQLVVETGTDRVLGAEILGAEADLLIGEIGLAIEAGLTATDLALTVHPHPGLGETLQEAAEAAHGRAVHIFQKGR